MTRQITNIRHFYRDPLVAAWMAKHFDMKFHGYGVDKIGFLLREACWGYIGNGLWGGQGFEGFDIHPDSLHLLELKEDDLIQFGDDMIFWVSANDAFWEENKDEPSLKYNFISKRQADAQDDGVVKIIQRGGKAFFYPESEAA